MLSGFNLQITDEQVKPVSGTDLSGYNQIQIKNNTALIKLIEAVPIGGIIMYASDTSPPNENYLPCIGQPIDQQLYPELYAILNGGPIPDLTSRLVRGLDPLRAPFTSEIIPSSQPLPVGSIQACMINSAQIQSPWIYCNGQSFDPQVYPELFSVLGSSQVPDLRDMFLRGLPAAGRSLGSYQADALKTHNHAYKGDSASGVGGEGGTDSGKDVVIRNLDGNQNNSTFYTFSQVGGTTETRPKNRAVNYMIYAGESAQQFDINCPYYIRCR